MIELAKNIIAASSVFFFLWLLHIAAQTVRHERRLKNRIKKNLRATKD